MTRRDRRWLVSGAVVAAVVAAVRLAIAHGHDEFSLWPDEPAQLAMARWLGGGVPWTMHDHSTWQPGYATLLSPVHWLTDDPVTVFHAALVLNAVLGGASAALLVALTRRLTSLGPWVGGLTAGLVCVAPAVLFTTVFVWAESLVAVCFLGTLLLLLRYVAEPSIRRGAMAGFAAAVAYGTHSRMLPLAAVVAGAAIVLALRRESSPRSSAVVVAATVGALAVVRVCVGVVVDRLWDQPSPTNTLRGTIDNLQDAPWSPLLSFAGQLWYLAVSTLGIVVYGCWALARDARGARRRDTIVLAVTVVACLVPSVLFMANRLRPDRIVYGRYNDVAVMPLVLLGLAFLITVASRRTIVLAASTALGVVFTTATALLVWRRDDLEADGGAEPMVLGLQPFTGGVDAIEVMRISAIAVVLTVGVAMIAVATPLRWRAAALLTVCGLLVVVGGIRTGAMISDRWNGRGDLSSVGQLADEELAGGIDVDFLLPDGTSNDRLMIYQMYLPHNRFRVVEDLADSTAPFVFAPTDDADLRRDATLVWRDPTQRFGLWER